MSNFAESADGLNSACRDAFGTECTYTPPGGVGFTVELVLEKPLPEDAAFTGAFLKAGAPAADFTTAPAKNGRVTVGSDTYIVFADPVDDAGWIALALNKC